MPDALSIDRETRFKTGSRRTYAILILVGAVAAGIPAAGAGHAPYWPVVLTFMVCGASAGFLLAAAILYAARGFILGR